MSINHSSGNSLNFQEPVAIGGTQHLARSTCEYKLCLAASKAFHITETCSEQHLLPQHKTPVVTHWKQISCKEEHTSQEKILTPARFFSSDEKTGLSAGEQITEDNCKRSYPQLVWTVTHPRWKKGKPSGTPQHYRATNMLFPFSKLEKSRQGNHSSLAATTTGSGQLSAPNSSTTPSTPVHQVKEQSSTCLKI